MSINPNIYFITFLIIFILRSILEFVLKPKDKHRKMVDRRTKVEILLFSTLYITSGTAVWLFLLFEDPASQGFYFFGVSLFIFSFVMRMSTLKKLKNSFSFSITPHRDDKLVTKGFYRFIRHPAYLFFSLEMAALFLIRFNYISLFMFAIDFIVTLKRIRNEEFLLVEKHGDKYRNYMRKTKKLIPFVFFNTTI